MLTYIELIELREKLINDEIELKLALELFWKDHSKEIKSWHTKDWKKRRAEHIKDKCEICNSTEILTLQHLSHPKQCFDYENEVTKKYYNAIKDSNTRIDKYKFNDYILNNYDYVPIPLCTNCGSRYPNKRIRKSPQYLCTECRQEFDEPIYKSIDELITIFFKNEDTTVVRDKCFVSKKWKNQHNLSSVKYWFQRETVKNNATENIEKEAFLLYLEDNIKYLSFEDTITTCRKCAANYDLNNMDLCPKCKKNYKGIQYPTCTPCLPEDKRKIVLEKIEFGKEWQTIHERFDID